jgi:hypothetical protein
LAGLLAAFFVKTTTKRDVNIEELVSRAKKRLGTTLVHYAYEAASQYGTDPLFVEAVMIVESLQRPKWFRVLEHRFGPLLDARSYGVMQVPNSQPMSDEESVLEAVKGYFIGFQVPKDQDGNPDTYAVRNAAFGYNPSNDYSGFVELVYITLHYRSAPRT